MQSSPTSPHDHQVTAFLDAAGSSGQAAARNVRTRLSSLRHQGHLFPITVNEAEHGNSYVVSPYTAYGPYALEELDSLMSRAPMAPLKGLTLMVAKVLKWAQIDRIVMVNNWLLSTNLYPEWDGSGAEELTHELANTYPRHLIAFRSLNHYTNAQLIDQLVVLGYKMVPARQVYIYDNDDLSWTQRSNTKRDRAVLRQTQFQHITNEEFHDIDFDAVEGLYNQLYLEKYSYLNPQFTAAFLSACHKQGVMEFEGLKDAGGRLVAIVGTFEYADVLTAPIVGYDIRMPQELGLYRMGMAMIFEHALRRKLPLNLSAGAASFKRLRGAQPYIEYTAVYDSHLSWPRRLVISSLSGLLNTIGVPVMERFEL